MIILGLLFWTGNAFNLVSVHMLLGLVLVIALWVLAFVAARSGVSPGLVIVAVVWGFIVIALGMTQNSVLPGSAHWVIKVLHLLVGIGAMGQAETLAARIKGMSTRTPALR